MSLLENIRATPPRRQMIVFGIAAAVAAGLLALLYIFVLRQPYAPLFSNLKDADAATIVAELDKKKTPYRLRDKGSTILVPKDRVDATRLEIVGSDLPLKGMVGFELFNKSDMGLTEFAQRINYQRALQGELGRTIMSMSGIDSARVHLTIPEETVFRGDRKPPKASVTVIPSPGSSLAPATVVGVQRLVSAAVADLEAGNVVVLNERGAVISGEVDRTATSGFVTPERQKIAEDYSARIRQTLEAALAPQELKITVWPDLDTRASFPGRSASETPAWPDGPRDFRLRVLVNVRPAPEPQTIAQIRSLTAEAIQFDPQLGDLITIGALAPPMLLPPIDAPAQEEPQNRQFVARRSSQTPAAPGWGLWVSLALAIATLGGLAILLRRPGGRRAMTSSQHQDFAARLTGLLDERGSNVSARS
jgi:flagellar M-ring protein FliF